MGKRRWAEVACQKLKAGETTQIRPRGHSMRGRINDGDLVTLKPCRAEDLTTNDAVLCRVQGRRTSHFVLHLVMGRETDRVLIGNNFGRVDGWISAEDVFGKAIEVVSCRAERSAPN